MDADADFQLFPMDRVAVKFAQRIGLRFIDSLSSATLLLVLLGLVGGYVVSAIGQQLRIDPQRLSRRALLDARSQIGSLSAWMGPVVLLSLALSFIYVDRQPAWLSSGSWVAGLLLAAFSPFLVLNRSMLAESGKRVWRVTWPGWTIVRTAVVVAIVFAVIDLLIQFGNILGDVLGGMLGVLAIWLLFHPIRWIFGAANSSLFCSAWLDRHGIGELWARRKILLSRSRIESFVALDVRLGVLALWFLPLILGIAANLVFIVPQIEVVLEQSGEALPLWVRWLQSSHQTLIVPMFAMSPLFCFMTGRLHVLLTPGGPVVQHPRN